MPRVAAATVETSTVAAAVAVVTMLTSGVGIVAAANPKTARR